MPTKTFYASASSGAAMFVDYSVAQAGTLETVANNPYTNLNVLNFHSALNYVQILQEITGSVTFAGFTRNQNTYNGGSCNTFNYYVPTSAVQTATLGTLNNTTNFVILEYNLVAYPSGFVDGPTNNSYTRNIFPAVSGSTLQIKSVSVAGSANMPTSTYTLKAYCIG
mgnify:FL=1